MHRVVVGGDKIFFARYRCICTKKIYTKILIIILYKVALCVYAEISA